MRQTLLQLFNIKPEIYLKIVLHNVIFTENIHGETPDLFAVLELQNNVTFRLVKNSVYFISASLKMTFLDMFESASIIP